jgi:hypothetical protein
MGVDGQRHDLATSTPRERPGTQCIGSRVGPRAGLDECGKSRSYWDSIPGPSSPCRVEEEKNLLPLLVVDHDNSVTKHSAKCRACECKKQEVHVVTIRLLMVQCFYSVYQSTKFMLIIFTSAVPISQKTCCVSIIKTNRLRLFKEIKAVLGTF